MQRVHRRQEGPPALARPPPDLGLGRRAPHRLDRDAPTPTKRAHLAQTPHLSANYWAPSQDTCVADCRAAFVSDDETRTWLWNHFKNAPAPVGYDPAIIPVWKTPLDASFIALKLEPWRLRVQPASVMTGQGGSVLAWREAGA